MKHKLLGVVALLVFAGFGMTSINIVGAVVPPASTPSRSTPTPSGDGGWAFCADEGGICNVGDNLRTVRYGWRNGGAQASSGFLYKDVIGSIACNSATFGNPGSSGNECRTRLITVEPNKLVPPVSPSTLPPEQFYLRTQNNTYSAVRSAGPFSVDIGAQAIGASTALFLDWGIPVVFSGSDLKGEIGVSFDPSQCTTLHAINWQKCTTLNLNIPSNATPGPHIILVNAQSTNTTAKASMFYVVTVVSTTCPPGTTGAFPACVPVVPPPPYVQANYYTQAAYVPYVQSNYYTQAAYTPSYAQATYYSQSVYYTQATYAPPPPALICPFGTVGIPPDCKTLAQLQEAINDIVRQIKELSCDTPATSGTVGNCAPVVPPPPYAQSSYNYFQSSYYTQAAYAPPPPMVTPASCSFTVDNISGVELSILPNVVEGKSVPVVVRAVGNCGAIGFSSVVRKTEDGNNNTVTLPNLTAVFSPPACAMPESYQGKCTDAELRMVPDPTSSIISRPQPFEAYFIAVSATGATDEFTVSYFIRQ